MRVNYMKQSAEGDYYKVHGAERDRAVQGGGRPPLLGKFGGFLNGYEFST